MRRTQTYCDRCGEEVETKDGPEVLRNELHWNGTDHDICDYCAELVERFLRGERLEHE